MRILVVLVIMLVFVGFTQSAFAQSNEGLRFYPQIPTDKSDIIAIISLTAGSICGKFELQYFELDGNNLSINVKSIPPPPETMCGAAMTQHVLEQDIGKLDTGTYVTQLYVDGNPRGNAVSFDVSGSDIAILSVGKYIDDQGDANLAGEVQNAATHPVKAAGIYISFFEDGTLVKTELTYATMAIIMPNRTSGFSYALNDDLKDKDYSIGATSFSVEEKPVEEGLTLVVESALDRDGYGIVGGHVFNGADHEATQVKIVCAIYDRDGNVIDSIFSYTDPDTIPAGQDARFNIFTHYKVSQEFTTSCNAESIELAIKEVQVVPEFPTVAVIAAASLATGIAVNRFRHKL